MAQNEQIDHNLGNSTNNNLIFYIKTLLIHLSTKTLINFSLVIGVEHIRASPMVGVIFVGAKLKFGMLQCFWRPNLAKLLQFFFLTINIKSKAKRNLNAVKWFVDFVCNHFFFFVTRCTQSLAHTNCSKPVQI